LKNGFLNNRMVRFKLKKFRILVIRSGNVSRRLAQNTQNIRRNIFHFSLFTFHLLFLFVSCKSSKKIVESPSALTKIKGEEVIQVFDSVLVHQFQFNNLTAKASVDYTDRTGDTKSFDINLRMKKDSAVWISITPLLGIEAARLMVTTDSVFMLDRVHKTVLKRDINYFGEMLRTNVNFDMLQSVIVGNYFQYLEKEKLKSIYEEEPYIILSSLNKRQVRRASEEKDPTKPVIQDFWIDGNYRIAKSKITDDKLDRFVEATYKEFTDVSGSLFPSNLVLTISGTTPTIMKINYSKVSQVDSLSLPFSVPEKYDLK